MSLKIYVISRPTFDLSSFLAFLSDLGAAWRRTPEAQEAEEIIEVAGRVCYLSFGQYQSPRANSQYIQNLIAMGHESVLEHVSWGFLITGVSRAFTHQLVRHRVGFAFSQLSQQYHDETDAQVVEPPHLRQFPTALQAWQRSVDVTTESYRTILEVLQEQHSGHLPKAELRRAIRSAARSVLINATETKIMVTANARALRHFLKVRGCIPGDSEMRLVSAELLRLLKLEAPVVFDDFEIEQLADGSPTVVQRPVPPENGT